MKLGTRSVLFGIHFWAWHPVTVLLAWIDLFGVPKPWELLCIFVHDLGYLGKDDMDGLSGANHPELGAKIAGFFCGEKARLLCLGHSRTYAKAHGIPESRLCFADKWSPVFDPLHFYWLRGTLSGEIAEYRKTFPRVGGQSSLMWVCAFKAHVVSNATAIWKGAQGETDHGYHPGAKMSEAA